jgi:adenosylmethionine-8-amino-7-oxononanoate aminotransferase
MGRFNKDKQVCDMAMDYNKLLDDDKRYVWHPFTPMRAWIDEPDLADRLIVAAEGFELIAAGGRRYIDGFGSLWCNLHGHRVGVIDAAIRRQLDIAAHTTLLGFASPPSIELARRLVEITPPNLTKVFFSDCGAAAVEVALKMAFQYYRNLGQSRRRRFIALREGYHGDTVGAVSLGGVDTFHKLFRPLLFETTFVDSPNPFYHPAGPRAGEVVLGQIDAALAASPGEYCGVFIEPLIQAAGGMLTQPPGFLAALRELTRRHDTLLIADEVATGFCRTGKLFACDHEGVQPDLLCLGKGLTGGYLPVAATLATHEIFDSFRGDQRAAGILPACDEGVSPAHKASDTTQSPNSTVHGEMVVGHAGGTPASHFYHGHTFTGNALGCAAAVASVDLIFSSGMIDALPAKVELISRKLAQLADHPNVGDIRQCGMMVGIDLVAKQAAATGPRKHFDPARRVGAAVCRQAREHNIIIRPLEDIVVLMPAPGMDMATLERLLDGTVQSIRESNYEPQA